MATRMAQQQSVKPEYMRPQEHEVVEAVGSLYADRLKPFGRILLKRLRECSAATATARARAAGDIDVVFHADSAPLIDPKALRQVCEKCACLEVQPEEGKEYSVMLRGRREDFVDASSLGDVYPAEMWQHLAAYLESLPVEEPMLPGGRYACAQVLVQRRLPFLEGRTLGEVCHIVQLAVSQRKLLGYADGSMVPFGRSVSCAKEQCALNQQPVAVTKKASAELPIATWEQARACLWEIMGSSIGQPGGLPLSNVKRLFRSCYGLELSETSMGYSRLSELLQDTRFGDICRLEVQRSGQIVVQGMPYMCHTASMTGAWPGMAPSEASPQWPTTAMRLVDAPPGLHPAGFGVEKPANAMRASAAAFVPESHRQQHTARADSGAPPSLATSPEPLAAGASMLSYYVQQLLELSLDEGRDALRGLSAAGPALRAKSLAADAMESSSDEGPLAETEAVKVGSFSRRRSVSVSRSTSEGSMVQSDDDGSEEAWPGVMMAAMVKLPPGLPPPPGLQGF